jgi:2-dehydrotetronate isomerase
LSIVGCYFYSTVLEAVSLIEEIGLPNIKLQFDVYHVARSEGDVLVKLGKYLSHIGHVQIAGVPARLCLQHLWRT